MSESHSNRTPADAKTDQAGDNVNVTRPAKTHPFTLHKASGHYCKKVRGRIHYFGKELDAALAKWEAVKDDLLAGRQPKEDTQELTVKSLCNRFLAFKMEKVEAGQMVRRSWVDYKTACQHLIDAVGKERLVHTLRPDDFSKVWKALSVRYGLYRLGCQIQLIRSVFRYAYESELIEQPMRFGPTFTKPPKKAIRIHKARQGKKLFSPDEIHRLLDAATLPMKGMILLGINAGMGNADVGQLPLSALDLDLGILDFARPKTGVARRAVLWPETVAAIRAALSRRPLPQEDAYAGLVFLTSHGCPWHRDDPNGAVCSEFSKLLKKLGIKRKGVGFYSLRHSYRTVADECRDQPAVDFTMGHDDGHISGHYREHISDDRLRAVADHVRCWLFPSA
jgi:integrase